MNSLIRSAKLDTTLRVLDRVRAAPDAGERLVGQGSTPSMTAVSKLPVTERLDRQAVSGAYAQDGLEISETTLSTVSDALPDVGPPALTKDELKILFSDELRILQEEAAKLGHEEGTTEGQAKAQQQYAAGIASLERVVMMLGDSLDKGIDGLTEIGAEVVFEAVVKIIGRSYIDQSGVLDVVKEVIRQAKDRSRLLIRVNPADYRDLMAERESLTEGLNVQHLEFSADDRVELGGCLLETASGNLDGRLEVQFQQLRDTLLSARHRRTESVLAP